MATTSQQDRPEPRDGGAKSPLTWGAVILGLGVAVSAGVSAVQLASLAGPNPITLLPIGQSDDAKAATLLATDPARAKALTLRALKLQPASASAWLRLAQVEARAHGKLTPQARLWLSRSYEVGPYDAQVLQDRTVFAYDHWADLGPDLRAQAVSQLKASWPVAPQGPLLPNLVNRVTDPPGRFALAIQLFTLKMTDAYTATRKTDETLQQN